MALGEPTGRRVITRPRRPSSTPARVRRALSGSTRRAYCHPLPVPRYSDTGIGLTPSRIRCRYSMAVQVVDFVGDETGHAALEDGDPLGAVDVDVLDADGERTGDLAADVEERQAPLVLLVGLGRFFDDARVEQGDRLTVGERTIAAARSMPTCGAATPMPFPKTCTVEARSRRRSVRRRPGGHPRPRRARRRARGLRQDRVALLDDADGAHPLARGRFGLQHVQCILLVWTGSELPFKPIPGVQRGVFGDQEKTRRPSSSVRRIAVRNGIASAVMLVSVPHTCGSSSAGKSRRTLSRCVGRRTARWNQIPTCRRRRCSCTPARRTHPGRAGTARRAATAP
jgi:hypothetical protein